MPFLLKYPEKLINASEVTTPFVTTDVMPTLLGLSGIPIPESVEGNDFSSYLLDQTQPNFNAGLIMCPVPFHEYSREKGGKEYRGVRTARYTYARDLNGPWLLYDNQNDPYQLNNLVDNPAYAEVREELEGELVTLLQQTGDEFKEADYYMEKWNYLYD